MENMNIDLPCEVKKILDKISENGFEAYVVGGCVRDSVINKMSQDSTVAKKEPNDWDICTSALPTEILEIFPQEKIIKTGLKHGTVTLVTAENTNYEITTFRSDGEYKDFRHPQKVQFVTSLREDLSRRDFTVNAMAYSPKTGIIDYFGGKKDILNRQIKCVGKAEERFCEDALRIMRALRFSSALGFDIEEKTGTAIKSCKENLKNISAERLNKELTGLLCGKGAKAVLTEYAEVLVVFIPEILPMMNFCQHSKYHKYDLWTHTANAVSNAPQDKILRLTMLFHDIAKVETFKQDDKGEGHFYGHNSRGATLAEEILKRLKFDNNTVKKVCLLILYHDSEISANEKNIKRWLYKIGEEVFCQLLWVKRADILAQGAENAEKRLCEIDNIEKICKEIIAKDECITLKKLAINGEDLKNIGIINGIKIGETLKILLEMVICGKVKNEKELLIKEADKIKNNFKKNSEI